jgi:hypothetical protein
MAVLALILGLGACALAPGSGGDLARQRQQAHDALDRWAAAVEAAGGQQGFSVTEGKTGQIGDWELAVGSNNKAALSAGLVEAAAPLPPDVPSPGEVRWEDGSTLQVPLISAAEALGEIHADGADCGGCTDLTPLQVTGATLSTGRVSTSRGPATVPMWEFSVEGTAVTVGTWIESASGSASSRELTVTFIGAPGPASEGCGADYTAEAVESSLAVVVIVIEHRNPLSGACSAVGAERTATVQLAVPLGERAVLEVVEGTPVPVTRH